MNKQEGKTLTSLCRLRDNLKELLIPKHSICIPEELLLKALNNVNKEIEALERKIT